MFKRIPWKTGWPTQLSGSDATSAVYIGFGVNIGSHGERVRLLLLALRRLNALPATRVLAVSSLYETPPWGVLEQDPFYNGVVAMRTALKPHDLLHALKTLEVALGRKHRQRWGPREIDLDILIAGRLKLTTDRLTIPHPQLPNRDFALVPLKEVAGTGCGASSCYLRSSKPWLQQSSQLYLLPVCSPPTPPRPRR